MTTDDEWENAHRSEGIAAMMHEFYKPQIEARQARLEATNVAAMFLHTMNRCVALTEAGLPCQREEWPLCFQHRQRLLYSYDCEMNDFNAERRELLDEKHRLAVQEARQLAGLRRDPNPTGVVTYIVRQGRYVKIGRTTRYESRMQSLSVGGCTRPYDLPVGPVVPILVFTGDRERYLHEKWSAQRRQGEWFEVCPEMEAWFTDVQDFPVSETHP